jgi:hypothetical protein
LSPTNLHFKTHQPVTTALRFGAEDTHGGEQFTATMAAAVVVSAHPHLTTHTGYVASLDVTVNLEIAPELRAIYDNSVNRTAHLWAGAAWQVAAPNNPSVSARHRVSAKAEANPSPAIADGLSLPADTATTWQTADRVHSPALAVPWVAGLRRATERTAAFKELLRNNRPQLIAPFTDAAALPAYQEDRWKDLYRSPRPGLILPWGEAERRQRALVTDFGVGAPILIYTRIPWQRGSTPAYGQHDYTVPPPAHVSCYQPIPGIANLRFWELAAEASLNFRFRCPHAAGEGSGETLIIPVRRVYMTTNTQTLVLDSTGQPIPTNNMRLGIDVDSWVWSWSANVPGSYLSLLQASPGNLVEVIATLNGTAFRFAVERIQRDRRFAQSTLAISGRGRAAWLADPYADIVSRANAEALTAQQLMADALTENGVSIGWDLDWQITDWLVPAGAWQHSGTAMDACLAIAGAGGAYIQAHRTDQVLRVLPRYPAAPWAWAGLTPDIQLPEDVCVTEGIEWIDRPAYNAVFISGQAGGIMAHVTRAGTDGAKVAPMVADPLITHADAGRQRGIAVLGDTGRQKLISLSLPVLSELGIVPPGKLVRYTENGQQHLGLTRSVQVASDFPKLRQTITVESHVL